MTKKVAIRARTHASPTMAKVVTMTLRPIEAGGSALGSRITSPPHDLQLPYERSYQCQSRLSTGECPDWSVVRCCAVPTPGLIAQPCVRAGRQRTAYNGRRTTDSEQRTRWSAQDEFVRPGGMDAIAVGRWGQDQLGSDGGLAVLAQVE